MGVIKQKHLEEITLMDVLDNCAEELESNNYHNWYDLPNTAFERLRPFIKEGKELEAARALTGAICERM